MSTMQAAIAQADDRAQREGRSMVVYHVGRDRYGRFAVFYVRPEDGSEGWAPFDYWRNGAGPWPIGRRCPVASFMVRR